MYADSEELPWRQGQRVGIFTDTSNLYHGARRTFGNGVNYQAILDCAVHQRCLIIANAYVVHNEERPEEDEFIHALREFGYRVKEIKLKILSDGTREGDWDIGITVDVMKTAPRLDIVVLASGDGDFIPLVEELQENGCRVEVMAFRCNLSAALAEVADEVILLDDQYFHY